MIYTWGSSPDKKNSHRTVKKKDSTRTPRALPSPSLLQVSASAQKEKFPSLLHFQPRSHTNRINRSLTNIVNTQLTLQLLTLIRSSLNPNLRLLSHPSLNTINRRKIAPRKVPNTPTMNQTMMTPHQAPMTMQPPTGAQSQRQVNLSVNTQNTINTVINNLRPIVTLLRHRLNQPVRRVTFSNLTQNRTITNRTSPVTITFRLLFQRSTHSHTQNSPKLVKH